MLPWSADLAGRIDEHTITSELLRGNPLGDPNERPLLVYVPPGYDSDQERRYPTVYVIQGYTGHVAMWRNRSPYRQPFTETADAVFARGDTPPAIVVYVDAWTSYGGSQFVDSPATGRYHSYLCEEVVPWVDEHYRTKPAAAYRAIMGKSSGGFGAMITPMLRPDLFGALASHSGDSLYEYSYLAEFAKSARHLRGYDGDIWRWWDDFRSRTPFTKPEDHDLLMLLGVSACFSANKDGSIDLPFDPATAEIRPEVWQRWLDLGSGADGAPVRRRAPLLARHLDRRRHPGRMVPRPGRRGVLRHPAGHRRTRRRDPLRAFRRQPHGRRLPLPAVPRLALPPHRGLAHGVLKDR